MTPTSPDPQKVAIVTGASQGIGAGIADAFARAGYAVVARSRSIRPSGEPGFLAVPGDIAEAETAERVVEQALDRYVSTSLVDHARSADPAALASLTKGGLDAVTRSLAIEYAARGIRVNAVSLGVIKTPLHDPSEYEGMAAVHPLGRAGEISDVVDGILYLEQAPFVTGETLHIDGGQAAGH